METQYVELTDQELVDIRRELEKWKKSDQLSWIMKKYGDVDFAVDSIKKESYNGNVVKYYNKGVFAGILLYSTGSPWWSPKKIVAEEFILSVNGQKGVQREAIKSLLNFARYSDGIVVAGNIFCKDRLVGNGYVKAGAQQVTSNYVLEVEKVKWEI